jgi:cyclophilin family peptidyl-prolyl cis-trans isomerase
MNRKISSLLVVTALIGIVNAQRRQTRVSMTPQRASVVELDSAKAPNTVKNFLDYVNSGFYDGTIFHRVIKNFMIQGWRSSPDMNRNHKRACQKRSQQPCFRTVRAHCKAATGDPHSATAQFFINTVNNDGLDFKNESQADGATVFSAEW